MYFSGYLLLARMMLLAVEAQQVIILRMVRVAAGGPAASREMQRLYSEKVLAAAEIGLAASRAMGRGGGHGKIANDIVRGYRSRVGRNRRRLS